MKFIAICESDFPITEEVEEELKNTIFVGNEDCPYCFEITKIINDEVISELKGGITMDKPKCCWQCEHLILCNPEEDECKLDGHIFKDKLCLSNMRDKECPLDKENKQ